MNSRALARLVASQVCVHGCMAGIRLAAPLLALRDGYSALAVGVLLALFSLSQVFLALPAGRFADRHGLRRPMGMAVFASVLGAALAAAFPVFPVLCLAALLGGAATGAASISLQRHVGRAANGATELKRVFSWLSIGPAASNFLGPVLCGLLIDHAGVVAGDTQGFRYAFAAMAVLPLITWFLLRSVIELHPVTMVSASADARAWDLMRSRPMQRVMLVNWCMASAWDVHSFAVPVLGHAHAFSASVIGSILAGFAIAAALVRVCIPLFAARLREHVVVTFSMLLTTVVFALYPFMQSPLTMGAASFVLGLALGCVQPMIMSTLHQITPHARIGEALGLRLMAINASSVLMPLLFGTAGAVVGVSVVFWSVGAAVATGMRPAWQLRSASDDQQ